MNFIDIINGYEELDEGVYYLTNKNGEVAINSEGNAKLGDFDELIKGKWAPYAKPLTSLRNSLPQNGETKFEMIPGDGVYVNGKKVQ